MNTMRIQLDNGQRLPITDSDRRRRDNAIRTVRKGWLHPAYRNASRILREEFGYSFHDVNRIGNP